MGRSFSHSLIYSESRARAGRQPWVLVTPAALSPTGKRRQKAFSTEKEGRQALRQAEQARAAMGVNMRHIVHDLGEQAQWLHDRELCERAGLSTSAAAAFAAQCVAEFGSLSDALQLARWAKGRAMQAWPDITLAEAFPEFRKACAELAPTTQARRRYTHNRLMREAFEFCTNTYLHQLTAANVTELLDNMGLPASVWNDYLLELSSLCTWAQTRGYIDPDRRPLRGIKKRPIREKEITALQPAQLRHLLRTACAMGRPAIALHCVLGAFAGIRPAECHRLTWADVGTEDDFISVRPLKSKTGGTRHISLRPVLRAWLDYLSPPTSRIPTQRITDGLTLSQLSALHRKAGMTDWPRDVLRHSFASYAIKSGTPLHEVQADMGHVGLSLLRSRYLNMTGLTAAGAREWWTLTPQNVLEP